MPEATPFNPPLTRWGHLWRIALCLLISGLAWGDTFEPQLDGHLGLFLLDLAGGVVAFVLVFWRRRSPFRVALVLALLAAFSAASSGPAVLALVSLATRRRIPELTAVGAVSIVTGQLYVAYEPTSNTDPVWVNFTFVVLITIAFTVLGMYVGSRRELLWTLRERAREAESGQELRVAQARSAERQRIAREMHDVLAHRISLITMHAGALAYRTDLPPEQVKETAELIQAKSHEALADLRQVLGVLREQRPEETSSGDRPQPTLCDLPALIAEATAGGMQVDYASAITNGLLPAEQIGRTVYRIVQEALTNARKHAAGAHVQVRISGDPDSGVSVAVRNGTRVGSLGMPTPPGGGLGLVGLRERAALAGGTLHVAEGPASFGLQCWLPWNP